MDEVLKRSLLFDFYGELLTEHQQRIYREVVFEDCTISEVAKDEGISRQGVHDMIRRTTAALEEYESRLHLVEKFVSIRKKIQRIQELANAADNAAENKKRLEEIRICAEELSEEL